MKNSHYYTLLIFSSLVFLITGCDKLKMDSAAKKPAENEKPMAMADAKNEKPMSMADAGNEKPMPMADMVSLVDGGALMAADEAAGAADNKEGVGHFKEGHWDVSEKHFRKAVEANPDLAEAHYNLALTLDKLGKHGDATNSFRKALDLAPDNPKIKDSKILMAHLGM